MSVRWQWWQSSETTEAVEGRQHRLAETVRQSGGLFRGTVMGPGRLQTHIEGHDMRSSVSRRSDRRAYGPGESGADMGEDTSGATVFDADRPLRVAALFSGGASGVRYLLSEAEGRWTVVGAVASDPDAPGIDALEDRGVEVAVRDVRSFYRERDADRDDMDVRAEFDRGTRDQLRSFDPEPDLLLLSGYMWIVTTPLVEAFPTLNVHPGDLTIETGDGRPYTGLDPVTAAVEAGDRSTRSTVHFVTTDVDAGPVLVRSRPLRVHRELVDDLREAGATAAVETYLDVHQEWMKWAGDGPAVATALDLVAAGRVERDGETVRVDGRQGFYDLGDGGIVPQQ